MDTAQKPPESLTAEQEQKQQQRERARLVRVQRSLIARTNPTQLPELLRLQREAAAKETAVATISPSEPPKQTTSASSEGVVGAGETGSVRIGDGSWIAALESEDTPLPHAPPPAAEEMAAADEEMSAAEEKAAAAVAELGIDKKTWETRLVTPHPAIAGWLEKGWKGGWSARWFEIKGTPAKLHCYKIGRRWKGDYSTPTDEEKRTGEKIDDKWPLMLNGEKDRGLGNVMFESVLPLGEGGHSFTLTWTTKGEPEMVQLRCMTSEGRRNASEGDFKTRDKWIAALRAGGARHEMQRVKEPTGVDESGKGKADVQMDSTTLGIGSAPDPGAAGAEGGGRRKRTRRKRTGRKRSGRKRSGRKRTGRKRTGRKRKSTRRKSALRKSGLKRR